jgi:hypothetical protein
MVYKLDSVKLFVLNYKSTCLNTTTNIVVNGLTVNMLKDGLSRVQAFYKNMVDYQTMLIMVPEKFPSLLSRKIWLQLV